MCDNYCEGPPCREWSGCKDPIKMPWPPSALNNGLSSQAYLQGTFEPNIEERYLHELAKEYHETTEAYDRTVCTGPIGRDGIFPANSHERGLIGKHARTILKGLTKKARERGIEPGLVMKAIQHYRAR